MRRGGIEEGVEGRWGEEGSERWVTQADGVIKLSVVVGNRRGMTKTSR